MQDNKKTESDLLAHIKILTKMNQDLQAENETLKRSSSRVEIIEKENTYEYEEERLKWDKERTHLLDEIEKREEIYVKKLALRDSELKTVKG